MNTIHLHADGQNNYVEQLTIQFKQKIARLKQQEGVSNAQKEDAIDQLKQEYKKLKKESKTSLF